MKQREMILVGILVCGLSSAGAQTSQNSNLSEHERDLKSAAERAQPTSNAGAVMNQPIDTDALAKKLADGFKPYVKPNLNEGHVDPAVMKRYDMYLRFRAGYLAGDVNAGYEYGRTLYSGYSGSVDKPEAFRVWQSIADKDPRARFQAGMMMYMGDAVVRNDELGRAMIEKAAAAGDVEAKSYVAAHPYHRSSVGSFPPMTSRTDNVLASWKYDVFVTDYWREGNNAHLISERDRKHREDAMNVIEHQAKPKDQAVYALAAEMYLVGWNVPIDIEKAGQMLEKAEAAKAANPDKVKYADGPFETATMPMARMLYAFANYKKDPAAFQKALQTNAGKIQDDRDGMVPYLYALAACLNHQPEWQRRNLELAKKNSISAAYLELGVMQLTGEGGPVDNAAAMQNLDGMVSPDALYIRARLALEGSHGVTKDVAKGQALMKDAAAQGQPDAKKALESSFDLNSSIQKSAK
ncbi:MAG: hypothetical protein V4555_21300 [Acidobacteriota bacterium]